MQMETELLAEAIRSKQVSKYSCMSPVACCLLPLLKALGWNKVSRALIEALPHFTENMDMVDLRNILVNLGYESMALTITPNTIKPELLPCLFLDNQGQLFVFLKKEAQQLEYFDAQKKQNLTVEQSSMGIKGTAYVFTDRKNHHGHQQKIQEDWFFEFLNRFRKLIIHLLSMTFVINLVALLVPLFVMTVYDKVIGIKSLDSLPLLLSGVGLLIIADLVLRNLRARLLGYIAGRMDYLIGVETFKKMIHLPPLFTEMSTVTAQLSRLKQFDSIRDFFTGTTASVVLEIPFVLLFLFVVAILAGSIVFIPVIMIGVYVILGALWIPRLNKKVMRSGTAKNNKQNMLMQTLDARKEIKAIVGERVWQERFREISAEGVMANYQVFMTQALMNNVSKSVMMITGSTVLGAGALAVMEGQLSMGALIATMALVWRILSPVQTVFLSASRFQQTVNSIRQINKMMKLKTENTESHSELISESMSGNIIVDRIGFRYSSDQDPALLGVSFSALPGEVVAIIGDTGSGKSTLLKILAGMYKPQAGALYFDNVDMRQMNAVDLRRSIAYVPQKTTMFHGTIAQNLRLANGLASDQDLVVAAEKAGILNTILALPKQFDTRIGDNSSRQFPPGFIRALSIARALTGSARVILFDEPGTSLDFNSDNLFMEQIQQLRGNSTVVMVSHRPSHIRLADKAILLQKGAVQFVGNTEQAISLLMGK